MRDAASADQSSGSITGALTAGYSGPVSHRIRAAETRTERPRAPAQPSPAPADDAPAATLDRGRALHAFDLGALAGIAVAIVYGLSWTVVQLSWGLIAVAIMGGWLIGGAVARGAWRGERHGPDARLRLLAAVFGACAWLGGAAVGYVLGQLLLPQATTPVLERISFGGFADYLVAVTDLLQGIAFATLSFFAWRSAR